MIEFSRDEYADILELVCSRIEYRERVIKAEYLAKRDDYPKLLKMKKQLTDYLSKAV